MLYIKRLGRDGLAQNLTTREASMGKLYYIGLDIHKKRISYCIKLHDGSKVRQGEVAAERKALCQWLSCISKPWKGAMEATMFTGWVYDFLKPHALELKVAHPEMLKAITSAKKKNDRADSEMLADLLRVNLLPECYMAPEEMRDLRRILRFRNMTVRTAVRMKNKISGLLMEVGVNYNKKRLHGRRYFNELLETVEDIPHSVDELLRLSRAGMKMFQGVQRRLLDTLHDNDLIRERVRRLMTIKGIGEVTALTWVLEIGDPMRFTSARQAISYCGLCSAQKESAGKEQRGPISKKRNKHLQTVLIEAAKLAPRWNRQLLDIYARELERGNHNRATLAVARKLVAYMLSVDKRQTDFRPLPIAKVA